MESWVEHRLAILPRGQVARRKLEEAVHRAQEVLKAQPAFMARRQKDARALSLHGRRAQDLLRSRSYLLLPQTPNAPPCGRQHIRKVLGGQLQLASFEEFASTYDAATLCSGIQQPCFIGACSIIDWSGTAYTSLQGVLHSGSTSCACKAQGSPTFHASF
eukprot:SM004426S16323  [mRNA]  locus=s4426:152:942:- [translate_table: standard]